MYPKVQCISWNRTSDASLSGRMLYTRVILNTVYECKVSQHLVLREPLFQWHTGTKFGFSHSNSLVGRSLAGAIRTGSK